MDHPKLSSEQLNRALDSLQRGDPGALPGPARAAETMQDRQTHRIEMDVQNQALRETQAELERALQRYDDLYDHAPIGYVTVTPVGKIVQLNLTTADWLRRERGTLVGGQMNWFFDAFDAGRFAAHLEACLANGSDTLFDITLRLDHGLLMTVQLFSRRAGATEHGEPLVQTAITNITRLRQMQHVLRDIDAEQAAFNAAVTENVHLSTVSVSNFARTILQQHAETLPADVKSLVERMEGAALRMEATFRQVLEYACGPRADVALDPISLTQVVQQMLLEHRGAIESRHAEISVDPSLPCVRGSRLILGQVLSFVLTESLKAAPAGAPLRLRIAADSRDNKVVLRMGEAARVPTPDADGRQFRLFERPPGGGVYAGSAVGIAIMRRAIERMNGRMWLEPDVDRPSSFNVELPKV